MEGKLDNKLNHMQIAYFLAVADYKSFSEASRKMFVAQSAISKQISSIEAKLGMKLFLRTKQKIELTPAGEALYGELKKYDHWLQHNIDVAKSIDQGKTGFLNVGIVNGVNFFESGVVRVQDFFKKYSNIQTNIWRVILQIQLEKLKLGSLDIMFTYAHLVNDYTGLSSKVLYSENERIAVSKFHPLGKKKKITREDLLEHSLITISPEVSSLGYMKDLKYFEGLGLIPQKVLHAPTLEDVTVAVEFGVGYGLAGQSSSLRNNKSVVFKDLYTDEGLEPPRLELMALWRNEITNPAVKIFVDYVINSEKFQKPDFDS